MNTRKPQQRWPRDVKLMAAGWYPDPWDLSGKALTERWWNGLIWVDRTRVIDDLPVRHIVTPLPKERKPDD